MAGYLQRLVARSIGAPAGEVAFATPTRRTSAAATARLSDAPTPPSEETGISETISRHPAAEPSVAPVPRTTRAPSLGATPAALPAQATTAVRPVPPQSFDRPRTPMIARPTPAVSPATTRDTPPPLAIATQSAEASIPRRELPAPPVPPPLGHVSASIAPPPQSVPARSPPAPPSEALNGPAPRVPLPATAVPPDRAAGPPASATPEPRAATSVGAPPAPPRSAVSRASTAEPVTPRLVPAAVPPAPPRSATLRIGRIEVEVLPNRAPAAPVTPPPSPAPAPRGVLSGSPLLGQRFGFGQI